MVEKRFQRPMSSITSTNHNRRTAMAKSRRQHLEGISRPSIPTLIGQEMAAEADPLVGPQEFEAPPVDSAAAFEYHGWECR